MKGIHQDGGASVTPRHFTAKHCSKKKPQPKLGSGHALLQDNIKSTGSMEPSNNSTQQL
jgi:hypothetical protein